MQNILAPVACLTTDEWDLETRYHKLHENLARLVVQVDSPYPREELVRHALEGSIKLYDALILARLIDKVRPRRILEVGAFIGFSTRWLLEASRVSNAHVVSIDPNIRHRIFERPTDLVRQFNASFESRLTIRCGFFSQRMSGDYTYDYDHYVPVLPRAEADAIINSRPILTASNLGEEPFDFIFIDGDHCEDSVLSNFAESRKLLAPRGCIAFHDAITWPDVHRALCRLANEYGDLGELEILGNDFLQLGPPASCDGIGVFRFQGSA